MPLTSTNIFFQALSLAVLWLYCRMIYRQRAQVAECFRGTVRLRAADEAGVKRPYDSFVTTALALGAVSTGLGVAKALAAGLTSGTGVRGSWQWRLADVAGTAGVEGLPRWVAPTAALAVAAAVVCVAVAGAGVLRTAGGLTLSRGFAEWLLETKKNTLAAAAVVAVPLIAMWTGANPARDLIVAYTIAGVAVTTAVVFVIQTFAGFVRQKVSVLVWFLYLCGVEILPICALVLVAVKQITS